MARYEIRDSANVLLNIIEWDGVKLYSIVPGTRLIRIDTGGIVKEEPPLTDDEKFAKFLDDTARRYELSVTTLKQKWRTL